MRKPLFSGTCTALVTPFLNGKVNFPMAEQLLRRQIHAGVPAVVLAGTTGESPTLSDEEKGAEIGVWGQRHLRYIKHHRKILYLNLLTSGKLNGYLADLDKQADEMFSLLVKQMAESEGVTEQLKADNQMEWVDQMNNIRGRAAELVNTDLIYG